MTLYEVLNFIAQKKVPVSPFVNYDPTTEIEYADDGCEFKANGNCWPIQSVKYSERGNLNITVFIDGTVTEPNGAQHDCKQARNATVVKNGKLNIQYLQLTKDKAEQSKLPPEFNVKNNIIDLGQFPLTDKTSVSMDEIFKEGVYAFMNKLNKRVGKEAPMTEEQFRLSNMGLKPDGFYCKPKRVVAVEPPEHDCKVSIAGCSNKTTKLATTLKEFAAVHPIPKSKVNELMYTAQVLNIHGTKTSNFAVTPTMILNGTVKC